MKKDKSGTRRPPPDAKLERNYREIGCRGVLGAARLVNHPLKRETPAPKTINYASRLPPGKS